MRGKVVLPVLLLAVIALVGCGGGEKRTESGFDLNAGIAGVKSARAALTAARADVDKVRANLEPLEAQARLSPEDQARKTQLEAELKAAQARYDEAFAADQSALSGFLNETLNDEQLRKAPETKTALDLYAEQAAVNAREYIDRSGDYRRAIELLESAEQYYGYAGLTPPAQLTAAMNEAKDKRFVTRARFDQLKKGMSEAEVKAIIGTPFYANVRENEIQGKKITHWLLSREDGGVAAIYFDRGKLYAMKWDVKEQ